MKRILGILSIIVITFMLLLAIVLKSDQEKPEVKFAPRASIELPTNDIKLYNLVNQYRHENKLNLLAVDQWLCSKAQIRSEQIKTDWSHDKFFSMTDKYGSYSSVGENLAKDWNTDTAIVNAWIASKTHRENMLNDWTHTCVVRNGRYIAQWFGK